MRHTRSKTSPLSHGASHGPNGGVADTLDEAQGGAFRAAWQRPVSLIVPLRNVHTTDRSEELFNIHVILHTGFAGRGIGQAPRPIFGTIGAGLTVTMGAARQSSAILHIAFASLCAAYGPPN
jgi:hypothetical protein